MFCSKCGFEISDDSNTMFCPKCGNNVKSADATTRPAGGSVNVDREYRGKLSDGWAWALALVPLIGILMTNVFDIEEGSFFFILLCLNTVFWSLDRKELKQKGKWGKYGWLGIFLVPVYLFIRDKKVNREHGNAIMWGASLLLYLGIVGYVLFSGSVGRATSAEAYKLTSSEVAETGTSASAKTVVSIPGVIMTSINEMLSDYDANEVAADNKYRGKWLYLEGAVRSVKKVFLDSDPSVALETNNPFFVVSVSFKDKSQLGSLRKGQRIRIIGKGGGGSGLFLQINEARFATDSDFITTQPQSTQSTGKGSSFTDSRDGKTYKTVIIGGKKWMAQNLNYQTSSGSWCYENKNSNCDKYGRLYDKWTAGSVCPSGWSISPSWYYSLRDALGCSDGSGACNGMGTKLKSNAGWYNNGNGTDAIGFSGLPGGYRDTDGSFKDIGKKGYWWDNEVGAQTGFTHDELTYNESDYGSIIGDEGTEGYSVRCVADK